MAKKKNKKQGAVRKQPLEREVIEIIEFYESGFWKKHWWQAVILFFVPLIMYYQTLDFGYVLDDQIVITDNNFTKKGLSGIGDLLTTESMEGYFGEQKDLVQGNRYRPLSLISFAAEYDVNNGPNPGMSHLMNILLYGLTGILLLRVLCMLFRKRTAKYWWFSIPFIASLMYIVHPIHSEAVANIKGRDEIMAMFFSLTTLYASLRYIDKKSIIWLISSCILFFLALLSKENSITFLAVIPISIYFFSEYKTKRIVMATLPLIMTTIGYLALRFSVAGVPEFGQEINDLMNNPFLGMSGGEKYATISYSLLKYIQLFLFPHPLSHDYYPYALPVLSWADPRALLALGLHVGLLIWAVRGIRAKKLYSYAILYYFATLSIASNVVINLGTFMNERFIYMASLGLVLLLTWFIVDVLSNFKRSGLMVASGLILLLTIGFFTKTMLRVPDWESALALNSSAVKYGTNSARANSFMATALYQRSLEPMSISDKIPMLDEALEYSNKALRIYPSYKNANLMKVGIAAQLHRIDQDERKLLKRFGEVMSARPDIEYLTEYLEYFEPRTKDLDYLLSWYARISYENILLKANQPSWALHFLNRAYNLDDKNKEVLEALSKVYLANGDQSRAQYYQNAAMNGR